MHRAIALTLLVALGCDEPTTDEEPAPAEEPAAEEAAAEDEPSGPPEAGPIPESWVEPRVEAARERMQGSAAAELVWQAIEAHGGLAPWLSKGTVSFTFDYAPIGNPDKRMYTRNRVDFWRARAVQDELDTHGVQAHFGWDGAKAWITPDPEAFPSPARFWALSPYYFIGMPFVGADPGTRYERLEDAELDGQTYRIVRLTYEPGTGDSPDDYYVLYLHPDTHEMAALRYVVAYPGFFPQGGHSPEKLMRYTDYRELQGLTIAHRMDAYRWDPEAGEPGEKVTDIEVRDVAFGETWAGSIFAPPEGAVVSETIEPTAD